MSDSDRFSDFLADVLHEEDLKKEDVAGFEQESSMDSEQERSNVSLSFCSPGSMLTVDYKEQESSGKDNLTEQITSDSEIPEKSSGKKSFEISESFRPDEKLKEKREEEKKERSKERKEEENKENILFHPITTNEDYDLSLKTISSRGSDLKIARKEKTVNPISAKKDNSVKRSEGPVIDKKSLTRTNTPIRPVKASDGLPDAKQGHPDCVLEVEFEKIEQNMEKNLEAHAKHVQVDEAALKAAFSGPVQRESTGYLVKRSEEPEIDNKPSMGTNTLAIPVKASDEPLSEKQEHPEATQTEKSKMVDAVIAHYKKYHPRARPGPKERALINKRLQEKYTVKELSLAIDGCHMSDFHCGLNEQGKKYQQLTLIMRDSSKVTNFIEIAEGCDTITNTTQLKQEQGNAVCQSFLKKVNGIMHREQSK